MEQSVKEAAGRLTSNANKRSPSTPAGFEMEKKQAKQREVEEIMQARQRAREYNATLRHLKATMSNQSTGALNVAPMPLEEVRRKTEPATRAVRASELTMQLPPPAAEEEEEEEELFSSSRRNSVESLVFLEDEEDGRMLERGYEEIHAAVLMDRPSMSDVLLGPRPGYRKTSLTSVGPAQVVENEDPHRLVGGVTVEQILRTFYSMYAPEKLEDADIVLQHFKNRTEALLYSLECKYFVVITPEGLIIPYNPASTPNPGLEDERIVARRAMSLTSEVSTWTTNSHKGYEPPRHVKTGEEIVHDAIETGGESEFL